MLRSFFYNVFKQTPALAVISAIIGAATLGLSPIFVRSSEVGPIATAFFRFFFAMPLLWTWMIFDNVKSSVPKTPRTGKDYFLLIAAGIFLAIDITLWHLAMVHTTIVNASLLNSLTSIFVAISAWLLFGERMSIFVAAGICLALSGTVILVGHNLAFDNSHLYGDALAISSAVFFTVFILIVKHLRSHFTTPTILAWSGIASLYVLAFTAYFLAEQLIPETSYGWFIVIGLAVIVHVGGQGLMSYSMAHVTATFSALSTLIGPVVAAVLGWLFFQETLNTIQIFGCGLVMAGIVVSRQNGRAIKFRKKIEKKNYDAS